MGIVTGYLGLVCFLVLLVKAVTRKFNLTKMNRVMMRVHKPVCVAFLFICFLHFIFVFPVLKTRNMFVTLTGIITVAAAALVIVLCHAIKDKKRNLAMHRMLAIVMLCCIVGHIVVYFVDYQDYQNRIRAIEIENVTISNVEDGTYIGAYDAGYIYAKVEVKVQDGQITDIQILEHNHERGALAESITDKVVAEQQIDVDAISSATNSSMVIKEAIENALTGY